ncbi:amidohydrolase family protein [Pollutibacter soli]|uniref:amidohydrolase family protein n=1 Tax=Pollutibacter soli TaxID=3034157 RepID=UPI003013B38A
MTIDSHQHFWKFNEVRDAWITPDMEVIRKDFLPDQLLKIFQTNAVDGCVAVQADESEDENKFLLGLASEYSFIKAVVGWLDFKSPAIEEKLIHAKKEKKLKGFRNIIQGKPDELYLTNASFKNGLKWLSSFNLRYDLLVYQDQLPSLNRFVENFPDQFFMLDHLGKPAIKYKEIKRWREQIRILSKHPLTYCKLSGMVTEADWKHWKYEDLSPYLEIAAEFFGVERLCFGSDWPVCLLAASYGEVQGILTRFLGQVSEEERKKVMGGNAIRFYQID